MITSLNQDSVVVFDLDDTLYQEEDFLLSAYAFIASELEQKTGKDFLEYLRRLRAEGVSDVFGELLKIEEVASCVDMAYLLERYRFHTPDISLSPPAKSLLDKLCVAGIRLALITDGRSVTQRNKLKALGVSDLFEPIVISDEIGSCKPHQNNYLAIENRWPAASYFYIADNTAKDFIVPNHRGWVSVCLKDAGRNIHPQSFELSEEKLPQHVIASLSELEAWIGHPSS